MKKDWPLWVVLGMILITSIPGFIHYLKKPETSPIQPYKNIWDKYDSLMKVNDSLKVKRTIDIQEASRLRSSINSLKAIRPKNIKHTNDEVSRLQNSTTAGKLLIIDSILRSRRQH